MDTDPFSVKKTLKHLATQDRGTRFMGVYLGLAVLVLFLAVASITPQIGEKLGTLSIKKQTQVSRAATLPNPKGPCYPYGDVDANGTVDSVDSLKILRYASRLPVTGTFNRSNADVDADGNITKADGQMVLNYIAGSISTFPACALVEIPTIISITPRNVGPYSGDITIYGTSFGSAKGKVHFTRNGVIVGGSMIRSWSNDVINACNISVPSPNSSYGVRVATPDGRASTDFAYYVGPSKSVSNPLPCNF